MGLGGPLGVALSPCSRISAAACGVVDLDSGIDALYLSGCIALPQPQRKRAAEKIADEFAAFVAASCVRHGVPVKVTDTASLAVVATLLQDRDSRTSALAVGG